ncbi:MAG: YfiR family protein [Gammaproteobacteria bacterium]|nr:YfiR family protein [Gammaproteobacteria bacterium]
MFIHNDSYLMPDFFNVCVLSRVRGQGLGIMLCLFLSLWGGNCAALSEAREYQVKAVFLLNFAGFVTWPDAAFASARAPFHICVLGENPFGNALNLTVKNEYVGEHAIMVEYLNNPKKIAHCHILFINRSEKKRLPELLERLQQHPVFTISDMDDFVVRGGMVQFFKHGKRRKVRFYVDPKTIKKTGLRISADILRFARIVHRPYQ